MQKKSKECENACKMIEIQVEIFDYFNGLQDLEEKKIRCVGNAVTRFSEDALRILRALRFASSLPHHFSIESSSKNAIFECKNLLKHISKERINAEISRLILGENVTQILREFKEIFVQEMPVLKQLSDSDFERNINALACAPKDLEVRLSLLFYGTQNVQKTLKALKFSRKNIANIKAILNVEKSTDSIIYDKKSLKKLLLKYEKYPHANIVLKWLEMRSALDLTESKLHLYNEIITQNESFYIAHLAIDGSEILKLFKTLKVKFSGKNIGEILNMLILEIIDEKLQNNSQDLLKRAKEIIESNVMQS